MQWILGNLTQVVTRLGRKLDNHNAAEVKNYICKPPPPTFDGLVLELLHFLHLYGICLVRMCLSISHAQVLSPRLLPRRYLVRLGVSFDKLAGLRS
jgi:hypothetical protein